MNSEATYSLKGKKVWVAGHKGMVGGAISRQLEAEGVSDIITASSSELDLRDSRATEKWVKDNKPDAVFVAAAKVGGIMANSTYPADFLYDNLMIASNCINGAFKADVEKLLFLGSSCIYPKFAEQPIKEESLLTGALEPTNEWYAIAKIAGIKLCQAYRQQYGVDYISAMPTNLYGPGDNYDLQSSHVIPALIRKAETAKRLNSESMEIWGTGTPMREFLHSDDCAGALIFLMKTYSGHEHVNVGSGVDLTIEDLARLVMKVVGYEGALTKDLTKPDGTPRKLMSAEKLLSMGWKPSYDLESGLRHAYEWYLNSEVPVEA